MNNRNPIRASLSDRERLDRIVAAAQETKAEGIVVFDMDQRSPITDFVMVCSGRSQAHVRGIAERIMSTLQQSGVRCQALEGFQEGSWVLLDYDVVIVHVFHPETREYYDLESLLADFTSQRFSTSPPNPDDATSAA